MSKKLEELKIVMVCTYPPKECGIATYSFNLYKALKKADADLRIYILAMVCDKDKKLKYPSEVKEFVNTESVESYKEAAEYINSCGADLVCIQHEFGIYGGFDGVLLLKFMEQIKLPIVTSLHTVPITLEAKRRDAGMEILRKIIRRSKRVLIMTKLAKECLMKEAGAPNWKLEVILHGTPDVKFATSEKAKEILGLSGKKVISTIGLINPHKGIDKIVEALPEIVKKHKDLVYVIAGAIHPKKKQEMDILLAKVMNRAKELKVEKYIKRVDKYFTEKELITYFQASDIYMTIYDVSEQVSSGTLAYAIACGRCVVSTPYIYAKELIGQDKRGFIVEFGDLSGIAKKVNYILGNPLVRKKMERKIYEFGRKTTWEIVAKQHLEVFERII